MRRNNGEQTLTPCVHVDFLPSSTAVVLPPEHVVIAIIISPRSTFSSEIFVCFFFPIHFLPHGLSVQSSELRFSLWTGELKAAVSSGQQPPCSGCPISQHRTRALNKLVIIRSTAAAAVIVKMEFQPT